MISCRYVVVLFSFAFATASTSVARAQVVAHRPVEGEVTGLEMSIEGPTSAAPGDQLRWLVTVYEVVGQRELRPAPGATVRAFVSYERARPAAEITADTHGRAQVDVTLPEELERTVMVILEATSVASVRRSFRFEVRLAPSVSLHVAPLRSVLLEGERLDVIGRALSVPGGAPLEGVPVSVELRSQSGSASPRRQVQSGPGGMFRASFDVPEMWDSSGRAAPDASRQLEVVASAQLGAVEDRVSISVRRTPSPSLVVRVHATPRVVEVDEEVTLTVAVRAPDGSPVEGALVDQPAGRPLAEGTSDEPVRTDAAGQATLRWRPQVRASRAFDDVTVSIEAHRPGHGPRRVARRGGRRRPRGGGARARRGSADLRSRRQLQWCAGTGGHSCLVHVPGPGRAPCARGR